jgi:tRNA G18 (ribose-2'-O)-methylase SpoU
VPVLAIDTPRDPRLNDYVALADPDLARRRSLFVVEGRLTVRRLIADRRHRVVSLLVSEAARRDLAPAIATLSSTVPIYVCDVNDFRGITGFNIHRGCLALAERPEPTAAANLLSGRLLIVLEAIANADNVGGIFRNAAAFGADGVLISPTTCDPLYRKAIRTSMGASLAMPFARLEWPEGLNHISAAGLMTVALTPDRSAEPLERFAESHHGSRLALLFGSEGDGLSVEAFTAADVRVRIPISPAVDSLNVAVAAGIVLSRLTRFADV